MILQRTIKSKYGIFGKLLQDDGTWLFCTLEHSYQNPDGSYSAKVPEGKYLCVRGEHRLEGMDEDFSTFEISGVPNHSGILIHCGNTNIDSSGCLLIAENYASTANVITGVRHSREAFENFMLMMTGIDNFVLTVEE